ncbi:MAG TPA: hypothetical protein VM347_28880 [Nonomuraea sp.]|nr:hypothetical protein [Nonomuraea sp.]
MIELPPALQAIGEGRADGSDLTVTFTSASARPASVRWTSCSNVHRPVSEDAPAEIVDHIVLPLIAHHHRDSGIDPGNPLR